VTAAANTERQREGGASARLREFGAFWYDFAIGDDWLVAAGVVVGLLGTWGLHSAGVTAWWLLPLLIVVLLPASLARAVGGSMFRPLIGSRPLRRRPGRRTPPAFPRTPPGS
jgi:hypothetical protein